MFRRGKVMLRRRGGTQVIGGERNTLDPTPNLFNLKKSKEEIRCLRKPLFTMARLPRTFSPRLSKRLASRAERSAPRETAMRCCGWPIQRQRLLTQRAER